MSRLKKLWNHPNITPEPSPKTDKASDPCDILLIFHNARYVPENIFGMKKLLIKQKDYN